MADALITPSVGATMWAVSAGLLGYCARALRKSLDSVRVPLMGMLGAFIFAAQMINFSIPGTGSSGHLGGGLILAILLGPHAGFIVIASVLFVQALLFADGGLLALGCNIFNMGFFPCFVAYPLIFRPIAGGSRNGLRFWSAAVTASVAGLAVGALCVVLQTFFSGVSELPFGGFAALMIPIHLAIGVVEGLITGGVVALVFGMEHSSSMGEVPTPSSQLRVPAVLGVLSLVAAGFLSWFASAHPDGLEWAIGKLSGEASEVSGQSGKLHEQAATIQDKVAILPDYDFAGQEETGGQSGPGEASVVSVGTSLSGLVGGGVTLLVAGGLGVVLRRRNKTGTGEFTHGNEGDRQRRH